MGLIQDDLVYHKIQVPQSITMTIYAISVFGISISLPITLIIYRYSTKLEVKQKLYITINQIYIFFSGVPSNCNQSSHHSYDDSSSSHR